MALEALDIVKLKIGLIGVILVVRRGLIGSHWLLSGLVLLQLLLHYHLCEYPKLVIAKLGWL